jgi:hypothetical protein
MGCELGGLRMRAQSATAYAFGSCDRMLFA